MNPNTSARIPPQVAKAAVQRVGGICRLTDDDIHVAMSSRGEDLDGNYAAKIGVVILLIVIVFAFAALFVHVANR